LTAIPVFGTGRDRANAPLECLQRLKPFEGIELFEQFELVKEHLP
jgi:hypothetical protein